MAKIVTWHILPSAQSSENWISSASSSQHFPIALQQLPGDKQNQQLVFSEGAFRGCSEWTEAILSKQELQLKEKERLVFNILFCFLKVWHNCVVWHAMVPSSGYSGGPWSWPLVPKQYSIFGWGTPGNSCGSFRQERWVFSPSCGLDLPRFFFFFFFSFGSDPRCFPVIVSLSFPVIPFLNMANN